jgi:hypothetical protein
VGQQADFGPDDKVHGFDETAPLAPWWTLPMAVATPALLSVAGRAVVVEGAEVAAAFLLTGVGVAGPYTDDVPLPGSGQCSRHGPSSGGEVGQGVRTPRDRRGGWMTP